ncbi:MAG: hypothetical protein ACLQVN_14175 [Bryobacteraceae bacterium]
MKSHSPGRFVARAFVIGSTVSTSLFLSVAWADQVVMKNGDRLTGSIIKKDGKNLTIKTDQFGIVTTSWDQVVSVKACHQCRQNIAVLQHDQGLGAERGQGRGYRAGRAGRNRLVHDRRRGEGGGL